MSAQVGTITAEEFVNGYCELYAIIDGTNQKFADVSLEDNLKAERGNPVGTYLGTVTDVHTKKQFKMYQASCGGDYCNCALTVEEI
jgi:hypothetical protein